MTETKEQQELRILQNGPQKTQSDYEMFRYLIEKGYAKGSEKSFIISKRREDYSKILAVNWQGVTAAGQDRIDWLKKTPLQRFWSKYGGRVMVGIILLLIGSLFK